MRAALVLALVLATACRARAEPPPVQAGDLVFQTSRSSQSEAIRLATGSAFTHVGLVVLRDGEPWVLEASRRVRYTRLRAFVGHGVGRRVAIYRLVDPPTSDLSSRLEEAARRRLGRPYDTTFEWNEERLYCSELVYLVLRDALGIEVGELEPFDALALSSPEVRRLVEARLGRGASPTGPVLTPVSMTRSPRLRYVGDYALRSSPSTRSRIEPSVSP